MVRHALTGSIFALGSTRSTFQTPYCRIGDIVPAKRSVQLSESWRDNRTDLLRPKSRTRHRSIGALDANLVVQVPTGSLVGEDVCPVVCPVLINGQTFCGYLLAKMSVQ
jgi:hypothetical protein